jgi:hypothetical protein
MEPIDALKRADVLAPPYAISFYFPTIVKK